ncbi:DUF4911 domain-containing protein [Chrysiogenes arsenatis]|uniref:DUF4911 domain-containing protein n=1 Tax=Chrysiogenes arsenatis TaxID=309797 RepID=UPI00040AF9E0|nr:DUF4911 domain-containing protein [Chrysiogenes arsenatis]
MTEKIYRCRLHSPEIIYVNNILEGHEGLGIIHTTDEKTGSVVFYTTSDTEHELAALLQSLQAEGVDIELLDVLEQSTLL